MMKKTKKMLTALGGGDNARCAALEAGRLEREARKFGFKPQKSEYRLSPPLGTLEERMRFFSRR